MKPLIVIYKGVILRYHNWGCTCTSIYRPLSYPFRSLLLVHTKSNQLKIISIYRIDHTHSHTQTHTHTHTYTHPDTLTIRKNIHKSEAYLFTSLEQESPSISSDHLENPMASSACNWMRYSNAYYRILGNIQVIA